MSCTHLGKVIFGYDDVKELHFIVRKILEHYEKKDVLQLALQLNFWIAKDTCNLLYLYVVSAHKQVAWVAELQLSIYTMQFIAIQLQLSQNNLFSTTMQLHYNCTHDVMLTSLIVIQLCKYDTWYYEDFLTWFFFRDIDFHCPLWLLMMVRDWTMWHINYILK